MERKTSLLLIAPFFRPSIGGAETYADELCEHMSRNGHKVYVFTYQPIIVRGAPKGEPLERRGNLEVRRYWWIGFDLHHKLESHPILKFLYLGSWLGLRTLCWMLVNHRKVDVMDGHGLAAAGIVRVLKMLFPRKRGCATILALYNFVPGTLLSRAVNWILGGLDLVLAEKGKSPDELASIGVDPTRIEVFNQWVDESQFVPADKAEAKKAVGWEGRFVVLFVGRAIPEKGADALLAASGLVGQGVTFAFITNVTPVSESIREAAKTRDDVIFVGEVPYRELHRYYQAADIVCIPSRYEEGVARVISEAISCGTPMVASNRGSIPAVLDDTVAVVTDPTPEALAKAVRELRDDPDRLARLTANCPAYAKENFGASNLDRIVGGYDKIAGRQGRP